MSSNNNIIKYGLPFILLFLLGYFILQSSESKSPDRAVYFEYSAKCNLWEVRDMSTGNLKSRTTEGIKQLYELSGTKYSPLIKIDDDIIGYKMDGSFDWGKPISLTYMDKEEAKKIYGKDARYGLAELKYNTGVVSEFKACTSDYVGEDLTGLPLVLYEGTLSKKPTSVAEERAFNGLHIMTGQTAKEAYGMRAETRPVFNHYKTTAVSEIKNNNKSLSISNGKNGKIVIDYSSDRIGEIDILINQEFEQLVTTRHQKPEKSIRVELDPSDWPPHNFTISVFKAGTDFGVESELHRLTNGKIEIDFISIENNRKAFKESQLNIGAEEKESFVTIPGEQMRLPDIFFKQINYVINHPLFKVADPDHIASWHQKLRDQYSQIEYKRYVTRRFKEEAESFEFEITYNDKSDQFTVRSNDATATDIKIDSWINQNKIPSSLKAIALENWDEKDLPLIILDHRIIEREELLEHLNNAPLTINRFTELDKEIAIKRFGDNGKNGALVFRGIKVAS